jgi:predicted nucleic acid-binding protein
MLTLDTSALYAIVNKADPLHHDMLEERNADPGPYFIPAGILSELAYLMERDLGFRVLEGFLTDLESGNYTFHPGESDFGRIRELVRRYADLPLGLADASVVACAERHGGKILGHDEHFHVVSREGTIQVLPSAR